MEIYFSRKPYNVVYKDFHSGELVTIKRRPPARDNNFLPTDKVELTSKKNDDWDIDETYTVKHVSYRQPNTIQINNEDGAATFVASSDLNMLEEVAPRPNQVKEQQSSKYLLWP